MQSQKFNKNVNWNVKETYFNLHINYMAAFDRIKLLRLKKYFRCTLSRSRLVQTRHHYLLELFWGEANRSSHLQMLFEIAVLKNFATFIGKHQCRSIFLIKLQGSRPATLLKRHSNTGVFLWNCKSFKNTFFYRTPLVAASEQIQDHISVVHCVVKWCSGHLA